MANVSSEFADPNFLEEQARLWEQFQKQKTDPPISPGSPNPVDDGFVEHKHHLLLGMPATSERQIEELMQQFQECGISKEELDQQGALLKQQIADLDELGISKEEIEQQHELIREIENSRRTASTSGYSSPSASTGGATSQTPAQTPAVACPASTPPLSSASRQPIFSPAVVRPPAPVSLPAISPTPFPILSGQAGSKPFPMGNWSAPVEATKWRLTLANGWEQEPVTVRLDNVPFDKGNIRRVYHSLEYSSDSDQPPVHVVVKELLVDCEGKPKYDTRVLWMDVQTQTVAAHYADMYNSMAPALKGFKPVRFLSCWILRVKLPDATGKVRDRLLAAEPFLAGQYYKHNNNGGYVNEDMVRNTPQAFSHFTWHYSQGKLIVVDIQGVDDVYTDPQIHTENGEEYSLGNLGMKGVTRFFKTHQCNAICKAFNLNSKIQKQNDEGTLANPAFFQRSS